MSEPLVYREIQFSRLGGALKGGVALLWVSLHEPSKHTAKNIPRTQLMRFSVT